MSKVDLYTWIHKAQRVHLFNLSSRIGRSDFSDAAEAQSIEQELREMIAHLRGHAYNEATFVHPLFNEIGDQIAAIDDEHDDLEKELHHLEDILNEKQWNELYPEFNRFIADYLTHQDEEEKMQADVLWKHFDNDRLGAAMAAFQASRSPAQRMEDLKFIIPGLSVAELTEMFSHIKASAPTPAFQGCCQIAESLLDTNCWKKLYNTIKN